MLWFLPSLKKCKRNLFCRDEAGDKRWADLKARVVEHNIRSSDFSGWGASIYQCVERPNRWLTGQLLSKHLKLFLQSLLCDTIGEHLIVNNLNQDDGPVLHKDPARPNGDPARAHRGRDRGLSLGHGAKSHHCVFITNFGRFQNLNSRLWREQFLRRLTGLRELSTSQSSR